MQGKSKIIISAMFATMLAGCSQTEQVEPVAPQPIYNKYGEAVGCEGGEYIPGSNYENPCEPPEDCDPQTSTTADPCYRGSNEDSSGRSATAGAIN